MNYPIITVRNNDVKIKKDLVIRYLGYGKNDVDKTIDLLIDECIKTIGDVCDFRAVYTQLPVVIEGEKCIFPSFSVNSKNLSKNLNGCDNVLFFVATIGVEADRKILRESQVSQSKAVVLNAAATAAVESFCDSLCKTLENEYKRQGKFLRPRFSAGYGDFDIKHQSDVLTVCQSTSKLGVNLTENLMMVPTKSVSALIGISDTENKKCNQKCDFCTQKNCMYAMR